MATRDISFKEAEKIVENPSYSKVVTNNRFSILSNLSNFPELPQTFSPSKFISNQSTRRQSIPQQVTKRKRRASQEGIIPQTSSLPVPETQKTQNPQSHPIIPNPYRDDFMNYKDRLVDQIINFIDKLLSTTFAAQSNINNLDTVKIKESLTSLITNVTNSNATSD